MLSVEVRKCARSKYAKLVAKLDWGQDMSLAVREIDHAVQSQISPSDHPTPSSELGGIPSLSIVVPAYNERESLALLEAELIPVALALKAEVIIVDDGSDDGMADFVPVRGPVRLVRIPRSGKGKAILAGCAAARSDIIVTIDADLQEFPEQIPILVGALENADFAQGVRAHRKDRLVGKRVPSMIFNAFVALLFGRHFGDLNCGFRAFRRAALSGEELSGGTFRFLPLLVHLNRHRVVSRAIAHRERRLGIAKFNSPSRFGAGVWDALVIWYRFNVRKRLQTHDGSPSSQLSSQAVAAVMPREI